MGKYVIRRLVQAIPVIIGISIVTYAIMLMAPGGPQQRFSQNPRMTNEQREKFVKAWGLDQPIPIQYGRWIGILNPDEEGVAAFIGPTGWPNFLPTPISGAENGVLHGDLGYSIDSGSHVGQRIAQAALPTLILAGFALFLWVALAILLGVISAVKRYSFFDQAATVFAYVGFAMPTFWLGIMLIFLLGQRQVAGEMTGFFPISGMIDTRNSPPFGSDAYWAYFGADPITAIKDIAWHLVLPVTTLVVVSIAGDSRFVRASMLEALSQDYVRTARAKGLSGRVVVFKHALRNALLPVVTNIGLEIPFLFTGAIVTETIFSWPGIGKLTIDSITNFDYTVLMGVLMITSTLVVLANLLADILYAFVDPRIKY
ncbi:MAG TPA: ABC transporter permease [Candidatus Limnocylindrales bacterium]|nr:ABC transporter permease [Candidatus Limnocylindrales bacterium]